MIYLLKFCHWKGWLHTLSSLHTISQIKKQNLEQHTCIAWCCISQRLTAQSCVLPGELESLEAHQAERRQRCTPAAPPPPKNGSFPNTWRWIPLLICDGGGSGSGAGTSRSKHCYLWWFRHELKTLAFPKTKGHVLYWWRHRRKTALSSFPLTKDVRRIKVWADRERERCARAPLLISLVALLCTCV